MSIKNNIEDLNREDLYTIVLFALYRLVGTDEFSPIPELAYTLDEKNLLNLCEYFGGVTIRVPTIDELEFMIKCLDIYRRCAICGENIDKVISTECGRFGASKVKRGYSAIAGVMDGYKFGK